MESGSVPGGGRGAVRARRGLIGLLTANAVSLVGTQVTVIAVPWYVLTSTGSAALTGLVGFCTLAPYLLTRLLAGPAIDRIGARRVSVAADCLSLLATGAIPLLHAAGLLPLWTLALVAAAAGAARGPGDSAKGALVPQVAQDSNTPLSRVTGLNGTVSRLAGSIGPAIAGALVAASGPLPAVTVDAISFGIAAAIVAFTVPGTAFAGTEEPAEADGSAGESYGRRLLAGLAFLRADRLLLSLTIMVTATNMLDNGVMSVILPVWARQHGGASTVGLITSAVSVTAMLGSIVASAVADRLDRRRTYFACFLIGGGPRIAFLALGAPVWGTAVVWAVSGLALGFVSPLLSAVMYERIPARLMGRVSALTGAASVAGTPLGGPIGGLVIGPFGYAAAAVAFGAAYVTATVLPAFGPAWPQSAARGQEQDEAPVIASPSAATS